MVRPIHVLIVDDDDDLRGALAFLLQSEGHRVTEAAHGQCALDALASGPRVGLIILDLVMPVMDGRTLLAHKARGAHAAIPVVIFSSSLSSGLQRLPGVVSVVSKLEGIEALLVAIRDADGAGSLSCLSPGAFLA